MSADKAEAVCLVRGWQVGCHMVGRASRRGLCSSSNDAECFLRAVMYECWETGFGKPVKDGIRRLMFAAAAGSTVVRRGGGISFDFWLIVAVWVAVALMMSEARSSNREAESQHLSQTWPAGVQCTNNR